MLRRLRKWKALGAFFFGIIWFIVATTGVVVLIIPQVISSAYGNDHDLIDGFLDFMEDVFEFFKES